MVEHRRKHVGVIVEVVDACLLTVRQTMPRQIPDQYVVVSAQAMLDQMPVQACMIEIAVQQDAGAAGASCCS